MNPDILIYVCRNCLPAAERLPLQWRQDGALVVVRETPCSGKTDAQYLFHALEAGARGLCVVACPKGDCKLAQGNYRAEIRIEMVQRLLTEIGIEPGRAELLTFSENGENARLEPLVRGAAERICALGQSPVRAEPVIAPAESAVE